MIDLAEKIKCPWCGDMLAIETKTKEVERKIVSTIVCKSCGRTWEDITYAK